MSKIKIYLLILAVAIVAVALGYMMHIKPIQSLCAASLTYMKNPVLPVTAAVCAFLFYGVKTTGLSLSAVPSSPPLLCSLLSWATARQSFYLPAGLWLSWSLCI